jgi:hypothetical protein
MAHLGHVFAGGGRDSRPVIKIWVDSTPPPAGRVVTSDGASPLAFAGWLQLLQILVDALATDARPGEPDPGGQTGA